MLRSWSAVLSTLVLSSLLAGMNSPAFAEGESPVGQTVADFQLQDYRGKEHALSDYKDSKLIVLAFLGTECPLAKLYTVRLEHLQQKFAEQGVTVIGINANRQDSITEIAAQAHRQQLSYPILKDLGNQIADQVGAVRTPEVFLLDDQRVIRYWGRIDDQYGIGYIRDEPSRRDLEIAIEELISGKEVSQPEMESVGCYIGRIREADETSNVTYSHQISRIFQTHCVDCHREGEIAPFSLTQYEEVVGWAETIAEVVQDRRMPPWHANPDHGHFANERMLTSEEKQLIFDWVKAGAPEGDPAQLPEPKTYVKGWQLPREPDLVIPMAEKPFKVQAEGTVRYQYFQVDPGFTEDKWVSMAEVIPGNRAVVHHVLVLVRPPQGSEKIPGIRDGFLTAYVPGLTTVGLPKGMAKLIPAGSKLIFQLHYTPIGTEQEDLSKVGFIFADPEEVSHLVITSQIANTNLKLPPHEDAYQVEATSKSYPIELTLLGMSPHMHLRGKSFQYEAIYPDGTKEVLLDVPAYDFNWQTMYSLAEPKPLPPGTKVHCTAVFDNSENNLSNPDPSQTVNWGEQTWDEMMIGYVHVALPRSTYEKVKETPEVPKGNAEKQVQKLFDRFDNDGDGEIIRVEVPEQFQAIFDQIDLNKNDKITREEALEAVKKYLGQ